MQSAALNIRHGISEAPEIKNLENAIGGAKVEAITVVDAEEVIRGGSFGGPEAQNPDAPQITIGAEIASVTLGVTGNGRASDKYEFSRRSGEITPATKYTDSVPADKLRGWIYAIHTGSWGGLLTRILWLLGALLGASLPLTGYYIWIKHLRKKKHHEHIETAN